ncbi:acyltransferase family protein [Maricaulis sp.]|uniref:acyltransferase family protein n=1 Tax=Maricaulis sp. TaxID=1486257 RepID=UPI003A903330
MKLLATVREGYRADIDGLRALAVLSVVLFHIDKSWVPGGFIGVDIFFVISGFLITGNIAQEIERGSFKVTEFYRRRIRRIMPALSVVLLTCLLAGQILFLPDDMQDLAFSAIASQLSLANFYFLFSLDTGYFADDSALHPLLHLWTLGVEEQFYLLWPLALFAVGARGFNRVLIGALFVIAAASFIAAQLIAPEAPMTAYYMLPTRAGQLLAGALCYFLVRQRQSPTPFPGWSRELMGWGSLALIAASLIWIDESMPFPGILAIPVTLGSAGLLLTGSLGGSSLSRAFTFRPFVWIGLISYSLYLWHWPVLAFARYVTGELNLPQQALAFIVMVALSWMSFRWVEGPARRTRASFRRVFLTHFALPTAVLMLAVIGIRATDGLGVWTLNAGYTQRLAQLELDNLPSTASPFVCQGPYLDHDDVTLPACRINSLDEPRALLWGDSNAGHYVATVGAIAGELGFGFRNIAHSACPPLLEHAPEFANPRTADGCAQSIAATLEVLDQYPAVILAANWENHINQWGDRFLDEVSATVTQLRERDVDVLVIGRLPQLASVDHDCERKQLRLPFMDCGSRAVISRTRPDRVNAALRDVVVAAGARYVDFNDHLCQDGVCRGVQNGTMLYYNVGHLSQRGAEILGEAVIHDDAILSAFRPLVAISPSDMPAVPRGPAAEQLPSLINLLSPDIWSNDRAIQITGGLLFRDETETGYQSSYLTLAPGSLPASEARSLTVTAIFRRLDTSRPLLRVTTTGPDGRYDFILNAAGDGIDLRRGQPDAWTEQVDGDLIELTATIPFDPANSELRLDILPAVATGLSNEYTVAATGSIVLADIAIEYATTGSPAEPSP